MPRKNVRERKHTAAIGEISLTDQSLKKSCDINVMMAKFAKTGIAPISNKSPRFADVSNVKTLSEMYELSQIAQETFQELPAKVRKLMNNDASKLENFVLDEANKEICLKHGLLVQEKAPKKPQPQEVVIVKDSTTKVVE